jgi:hypothetical protein
MSDAEQYRTAIKTSVDIGGMTVHLSPGDVLRVERVVEIAEPTTRTSYGANDTSPVHLCRRCSSGQHFGKGEYCSDLCYCTCHQGQKEQSHE